MDKKEYGRSFQILNLIACFFIFGLCVTIILLIDSNSLFWGKIVPIFLSLLFVLIYGKIIEIIISRKYRYSWVRSLNKRKASANASYNVYKIDPLYESKGMREYQYKRLKRFRLINFFLYLLSAFVLIIGIVDFNATLFHDIILPIVMIVCGCGVFFVLIDFLEEALIKKFYVKRKNDVKTTQTYKKKSIYDKNLRIYYIPICLFIGIIILMVVVDFDKSMEYIASRVSIIMLIVVLFILILDLVISKINKWIRILNEEASKTIDNDIDDIIDDMIKDEKERDNNEV